MLQIDKQIDKAGANLSNFTSHTPLLVKLYTHLQEVDKLEGMGTVAEEEIQALVDVCDLDAVVSHTIFEQQLLQEQEGALVEHVLPHLPYTQCNSHSMNKMLNDTHTQLLLASRVLPFLYSSSVVRQLS